MDRSLFIRSFSASSDVCVCVCLFLGEALTHAIIRQARFSSCFAHAIYIKIYALFNHELVFSMLFFGRRLLFCVFQSLFQLNGLQHTHTHTDKQEQFKWENVQFINAMCVQSMDVTMKWMDFMATEWCISDEMKMKWEKRKRDMIITIHEWKIDWM